MGEDKAIRLREQALIRPLCVKITTATHKAVAFSQHFQEAEHLHLACFQEFANKTRWISGIHFEFDSWPDVCL